MSYSFALQHLRNHPIQLETYQFSHNLRLPKDSLNSLLFWLLSLNQVCKSIEIDANVNSFNFFEDNVSLVYNFLNILTKIFVL